MIETVLPFALTGISLASYFIGIRIREAAHAVIPLYDPVSLMLIALSCIPCTLGLCGVQLPFDPFGIWPNAILASWWVGYMLGYMSVRTDLVYVSVHNLVNRTQRVFHIVRYYDRDGRSCWQSQKLSAICKSMFLHVDNPLSLAQVQRTREISVQQFMRPRVCVDAIDLAGMESREYTVKNRWVNWKVKELKFIPSPHCTDSPYDWLVNAQAYEELYQNYTALQVEHLETNGKLRTIAIRGAGEVMSSMGMRSPSNVVLEQLGIDIEAMFGARIKAQREAARKEGEEIAEAMQ